MPVPNMARLVSSGSTMLSGLWPDSFGCPGRSPCSGMRVCGPGCRGNPAGSGIRDGASRSPDSSAFRHGIHADDPAGAEVAVHELQKEI